MSRDTKDDVKRKAADEAADAAPEEESSAEQTPSPEGGLRYRKRMNIFLKAAIAVFIVVCGASILKMQFEYNDLTEERTALEAEIASLEESIEELEIRISSDYDDDYVRSVAREKLNLRMPEEIIFYNDLIK